jgi:hypothetical protein
VNTPAILGDSLGRECGCLVQDVGQRVFIELSFDIPPLLGFTGHDPAKFRKKLGLYKRQHLFSNHHLKMKGDSPAPIQSEDPAKPNEERTINDEEDEIPALVPEEEDRDGEYIIINNYFV